ncbi:MULTISPECIES: hypothetical protein [unclassified Bradyrhizobium]|uniref:hypothetical protein n=1 Tax=unclassified Bradyrhizobium TaxID=2631580 RepID=UPI002916B98D|nr:MULTISPECIES: hypothetical protein [unclassified Bradyrhizobium]
MIAIKLDASAMEALFKDPNAKLELQQAVIAEMCRRMFAKYLPSDIRNVIDAIFKVQRTSLVEVVKEDAAFQKKFDELFQKEIASIKSSWRGKTIDLTPEMAEQVKQVIKTQSEMILSDAKLRGSQLVNELADKSVERLKQLAEDEIDKLVTRKVRALFDADIEKMVEDRVQAALKVARA